MPGAKRAETHELTIAELGARGDGIAALGAAKVFVPLALPGDRVRVEIAAKRPGGWAARVVDWLDRPAPRAVPPCRHFGACGGCALQHLPDEEYARWKIGRIAQALARAGLAAPEIGPLIRTQPGSRRRAELAARRSGSRWSIGFQPREQGEVVPIVQCPVLCPELVEMLAPLGQLLAALTPRPRTADLALLSVEGGIDLLLTLSTPPDLQARETLARFAEQQALARIAWRSSPAAAPEIVAERRAVTLRFGQVPVDLPPGAFLQATPAGEQAIVAAALAAIGEAGRIADLYAGAGTLTFPLAALAPVHAVEGDRAMAASLAQAARRAGLGTRLTVETRDLARRPLLGPELGRYDVVVFDPPRIGASAQAAEIARAGPKLVVAVSCNPVSFAADAKVLAASGYRLEKLVAIDQFLWSSEVELVGVLRR